MLKPPTSASRPPDVIHMMNVPRPPHFSIFSPVFRSYVLLRRQTEDKNISKGGLGMRLRWQALLQKKKKALYESHACHSCK